MSRVYFTVQGMDVIQERLLAIGQNLPELLMYANQLIAEQITIVIAELYPNMVQEWDVSINKYPGGVASVMAKTTDMIVRWYEYGTRAHDIDPRTAQALSFEGTHEFAGMRIITGHVDHPGAKAHNQRLMLLAELGDIARTVWGEELTRIIINFEV
jgi:hypothetical protein